MMEAVANAFLVVYLDTIDEALLEYLDEDDEMLLDAVRRLRLYTSTLLDGALTPAQLTEDWDDFFDLAPAFVAAYGSAELEELEYAASFLGSVQGDAEVTLTEGDRAYLRELETQLDMYPEMRTTTEE